MCLQCVELENDIGRFPTWSYGELAEQRRVVYWPENYQHYCVHFPDYRTYQEELE
jgi:hypothetical protein